MLMSPAGLRSEKGCAGDARQKLKSTDPTSRPTSTNPKLSKKIENGKIWSRVPRGCLTPRQRPTVTLTLFELLVCPCGGGLEYLHRSPASRKSRQKGTQCPWV
jgi:hypothetical protein